MDGQDEIEEPTTTMIVTQSMVDTIAIAIQDSLEACKSRIAWVADKRLEAQTTTQTVTEEDFNTLDEVEALARTQIEGIEDVMAELKEIYPHLEQTISDKKEIIIKKH